MLAVFQDIAQGKVDKSFTERIDERSMCTTLQNYIDRIKNTEKQRQAIEILSNAPVFSEHIQTSLKHLLNEGIAA